ncbi:hypothetical protein L484_010789 [Morus notabilis]|uniref:Uncharacterized protein n=1 Tax=Morus notabilis TaxID=981085 RepID=W9SAR9_9ROSA|nr:hypothetical protein L484_010789 [Morus notabilis]
MKGDRSTWLARRRASGLARSDGDQICLQINTRGGLHHSSLAKWCGDFEVNNNILGHGYRVWEGVRNWPISTATSNHLSKPIGSHCRRRPTPASSCFVLLDKCVQQLDLLCQILQIRCCSFAKSRSGELKSFFSVALHRQILSSFAFRLLIEHTHPPQLLAQTGLAQIHRPSQSRSTFLHLAHR